MINLITEKYDYDKSTEKYDKLNFVLKEAEYIYDTTIRRWGNIKYAQSCVYNYVWSEHFKKILKNLSELQQGEIRVKVMNTFGVKIWSWK